MNSKGIQLLLAGATVCISIMFFITPTQGANIVIGGNTTDIGTIIFVSPKPGDTPAAAGTALRNTIDGITDNSDDNPYLIKIGPGVYDVGTTSLQMKQYIDIEGSGEKTTRITSALSSSVWPPTTATLQGASNAELRFLTVENTGTGIYTAAILNTSQSPLILHVTATASGGSNNSYAIYNNSSSPKMTNVTASTSATSTGANSYAIYNFSSSPTMTNVAVSATSTGAYSCGVYNFSSSPMMNNVTVEASGGTTNWGVNSINPSTIMINNSVIKGLTSTIVNVNATTRVGNTKLEGGPVVNTTGTLTCAGVYDENYVFYSSTCP